MTLPLALLLAWFAVQRGTELATSARHQRALEARGAVEHGRGLFPWFVAVQCHPEFQSKPTRPHPLFRDFVGAALTARQAKKTESRGRSAVGV